MATAEDSDPPGVKRIRAANPSPYTLDGTNTYLVDGWVIDPGPALDEHLDAIVAAAEGRIAGIVVTHWHADHTEAAEPLAERAGGMEVVLPADGDRVGPFSAIATPGHVPDHVCLLWERVCFTGDTVLGTGSVFIQAGDDSLAAYLASLKRLRDLDLNVLAPGHGPYVYDPAAKLDQYIAHRLDREQKLLAALDAGARSEDELLDHAWPDAPPELRFPAALSLRAHVEKLAGEGRLPGDIDPGLLP